MAGANSCGRLESKLVLHKLCSDSVMNPSFRFVLDFFICFYVCLLSYFIFIACLTCENFHLLTSSPLDYTIWRNFFENMLDFMKMLFLMVAFISFAVSRETEMTTYLAINSSLVENLGADPILSCP